MQETTQIIDSTGYQARLRRSSKDVLQGGFLQKEVAERLLEQLRLMTIVPDKIIDISHFAGNTYATLKQYYPEAVCVHVSPVVEIAATEYVVGQSESLPFETASVDLVLSHLSFDWQEDLMQCFKEISRVLKPEGLLIFSMYGPDTLQELRYSFSKVSDYQHVHAFFDMHDIGDWLMQVGLVEPVMAKELISLRYRDLDLLFKDLRQSRSTNVLSSRMKGLMGKQRWHAMKDAYEVFRENSKLPATFEIIFGHAWKSQISQIVVDNEVRISVDSINKR